MIGRLRGEVAFRAADHVMLDVGGVGYVVFCSERTLAGMPGVGTMASLWTEMVVREDLMQLFGFLTVQEREWHRLLTSVQGVGAKVSLAILGVLGPDGVGRAIALADAGAVKAAPGVGPKLAQRVVNELQGKAPALMAQGAEADPLI
ncbi:MAG: Holliday junction branch migration protein RuvA, partial [Pseudomonadota bacterium]